MSTKGRNGLQALPIDALCQARPLRARAWPEEYGLRPHELTNSVPMMLRILHATQAQEARIAA